MNLKSSNRVYVPYKDLVKKEADCLTMVTVVQAINKYGAR